MLLKDVLGAIGNTPIVKLNHIGTDLPCELYVKLEFMNPGGSIKDRIGYWLIEDAEKTGRLKPGGAIVEGTSGNTGVGLAIAAAIKGYKCTFVLPDKMSFEKIRNLRAFGAKVVVTPTAVEPEDPRSYYSVSKRLARETPNAIYIDQYNNLANRDCHYKTTGPEILKQMPEIDAFVAGIGTGGTICGTGKYFKDHKPSVKVIAVDPVGSIVYDAYKTGKIQTLPKTYKIEGIGEDFLPANYDFKVIDDMVQVEDKESFLMTRELLVKEGLFAGISSGSAVVGAIKWARSQGAQLKGKKVLIVLPDSGNRYLSKAFDDDWMREAGFLEDRSFGTVAELLTHLKSQPDQVLIAKQDEKVSHIIDRMKEHGVSQLPVQDANGWIKGIVTETAILKALFSGSIRSSDKLENAPEQLIDPRIEFVTPEESLNRVSNLLTTGKIPLVTQDKSKNVIRAIITEIDLLSFLGGRG